ncbi:MAG TPA: DUF4160 domain-containing protein [Phycisphaerae bacterium]|nr:DUF4160 domain-containing protein [Phycisphaerae bacterium]
MPVVLRHKGYRFFFVSRELDEPPHIHVEKAENAAKFWLDPVMIARNHGFRGSQLSGIRTIIEEHCSVFLEKWYEHFGHKHGADGS